MAVDFCFVKFGEKLFTRGDSLLSGRVFVIGRGMQRHVLRGFDSWGSRVSHANKGVF